jgi:hypothetical protein
VVSVEVAKHQLETTKGALPWKSILHQSEIRRRTRVVGAFPDSQSALMLCAARLCQLAGSKWGQKRYLNMEFLKDQELEEQTEAASA